MMTVCHIGMNKPDNSTTDKRGISLSFIPYRVLLLGIFIPYMDRCFSCLTKVLLCKVCATYLAFLLYVCAVLPSIACDPVGDLHRIGINIKTLPQVIEEPKNKWPGDYSLGVIHIRSLQDCATLIHEMAHHYQFERGGSAQTYPEWWSRELEAEMLVKRAMQ